MSEPIAAARRSTRLSLGAYRPRAGDDEVLAHFREEVALLRANGHITTRPAPICRSESGEYLVIVEWATPESVDEAHRDPAVLAVWQRKEQLVEYLGPAQLAGSDAPFASYDVVEDG
ncbi:MAG TPA: hypothetical protein VFO78_09075 [Candidatus Limnocylindrales bacterium]|nr:hypothetical protein [Candidatus Limnocylindrales bacterium]